MITKERDPGEHTETDKFSKAGAKAEEQMAFYLRRAFVDDPDVCVFNDLRFKDETDDRAQIDHLILHRHGFIIIESKSVSAEVSVNEYGEWVRYWNGRKQGMPSPIQQARRQIEFLRRLLSEKPEPMLKKVLGFIQLKFHNCPFEILVAISDKGRVSRKIRMPEVLKADQVPDQVKGIIKRHKKARSLFSKPNYDFSNTDGTYNFSNEEIDNISRYLLERHCPVSKKGVTADNSAESVYVAAVNESESFETVRDVAESYGSNTEVEDEGLGVCEKCGQQCIIKWGRYGYYWKCICCDKNMALKEYCPNCKQKIKLRKEGKRFFKYCDVCKTPEVLYCEFE